MRKTDFDNKVSSLDSKISATISKNDPHWKWVKKKLKICDSGYFIGKRHFEEDGAQNYLVFQRINRYFKVIANTDYISTRKSKWLSVETIESPVTSDKRLTSASSYYGTKTTVKFTGTCLKQPKISYTHGTIVNIYIVY